MHEYDVTGTCAFRVPKRSSSQCANAGTGTTPQACSATCGSACKEQSFSSRQATAEKSTHLSLSRFLNVRTGGMDSYTTSSRTLYSVHCTSYSVHMHGCLLSNFLCHRSVAAISKSRNMLLCTPYSFPFFFPLMWDVARGVVHTSARPQPLSKVSFEVIVCRISRCALVL